VVVKFCSFSSLTFHALNFFQAAPAPTPTLDPSASTSSNPASVPTNAPAQPPPAPAPQQQSSSSKKEEEKMKDLGDVELGVDNKLRLNIWDYGGQRIFQSFQHLLVVRRAVYLVVFNMETFLESPAKAFSFLDFWLHTINIQANGGEKFTRSEVTSLEHNSSGFLFSCAQSSMLQPNDRGHYHCNAFLTR
jgi:hypothetical protein